ncbi:hypothetical protein [Ureaplasma ceti]|uniref:Uncharacterized protein n=1 Tax=Ureaplasma ceti TaxID=3119530 RepID=A0ABP9UAG8_9BACT
MKKNTKKIVFSGLALTTLIPIIAVAATSCSDPANKTNKLTPFKSTVAQELTFNQQSLQDYLNSHPLTNSVTMGNAVQYWTLASTKLELQNLVGQFLISNGESHPGAIEAISATAGSEPSTIDINLTLTKDSFFKGTYKTNLQISNLLVSKLVTFDNNELSQQLAGFSSSQLNHTQVLNCLMGAGVPEAAINDQTTKVNINYAQDTADVTLGLNPGYVLQAKNNTYVSQKDLGSFKLKLNKDVPFDFGEFKSDIEQLDLNNAQKESVIRKYLLSSGFTNSQISSVQITTNTQVTVNTPETISVKVNLKPGVKVKYDNGTNTQVVSQVLELNNLPTATLKTQTVTLQQDAFIKTVNSSNFDAVNTDGKVQTLLENYGLSSEEIKHVKVTTHQVLGQQDAIDVTITLNKGYLFNSNGADTLSMTDLKTQTIDTQPVNFQKQNFENIVAQLQIGQVTNDTIKGLLEQKQSGLLASQIASVNVTPDAKVLGKPETVTITVKLTAGYLYNNSNTIIMPNVATATVYSQPIQIDEASFKTAIAKLSPAEIQANNNQAVLSALEKSSNLTAQEINVGTLKVLENKQTVGQKISFTVTFDLNNGYLYQGSNKVEIPDVLSNQIATSGVAVQGSFNTAVNKMRFADATNKDTIKTLLENNGLPPKAIKNVIITPVKNIPVGAKKKVNVTILLNPGYYDQGSKTQSDTITIDNISTDTMQTQTVTWKQTEFVHAVAQSQFNKVDTKAEVQTLLENYGLTANEISKVNVSTNTVKLGQHETITVTIDLKPGYEFDTTKPTGQLTLSNLPTATLNTQSVNFQEQNFENAVGNLDASQVASDATIKGLLEQNGLTKDEVASVDVSQPTKVLGQNETVNITVHLQAGYLYNNQSTISMTGVQTSTIYQEVVSFDKTQFKTAIAKLDVSAINTQAIVKALEAAGLKADQINTQAIKFTTNQVKVGNNITANFTIGLATGYVFNKNSNITVNDVATASLQQQTVALDNAAFDTSIAQTEISNITQQSLTDLLNKDGLNGAIQDVTFTKNTDVPVGQQETITVTINLKKGYVTANNESKIVLSALPTKTVKTQVVSFKEIDFENFIKKSQFNDVNTKQLLEPLLSKFGIGSDALENVVLQTNTTKLGQPETISVTINLKPGYEFDTTQASSQLVLSDLPTATISTQPVNFQEQNFENAVGNLDASKVASDATIKGLLEQNGLKAGEIASVDVSQPTKVLGQNETVNITVHLQAGYLYNNQSTISMTGVQTSTIYQEAVSFDETQFKTAIAKLDVSAINTQAIVKALEAAGLKADQINTQAIKFTTNKVNVGDNITANFTIGLATGYVFNKNSNITVNDVATASVQEQTVALNNTEFNATIAQTEIDNITEQSLTDLLNKDGLNGAIQDVTFTKNTDVAVGTQETITVTINLKKGYVTANNENQMVLSALPTKTVKIQKISFDQTSFTNTIKSSKFVDVNTDKKVQALLENHFGLQADQIASVKISTHTTLGQFDTIDVTVVLKHGYEFTSNDTNTLTLSNLQTATKDTNGVQFNEQNFLNYVNGQRDTTVTKGNVQTWLENNGLKVKEIENVTIAPVAKVLGQPIAFNITVQLTKGNLYNGENQIVMNDVETATVYTQQVKFDKKTFTEKIGQLSAQDVNQKNVLQALEAAGLAASQINTTNGTGIKIVENTVNPGSAITFNFVITLATGYELGEQTSITANNVPSKTTKIVNVTLDQQNVIQAIAADQIDSINTNSLQTLVEANGLTDAVESISALQKNTDVKVGSLETVTFTINLKSGYEFANKQTTMTLTATTATMKQETVHFDATAFTQKISTLNISQVNTNSLVKTLLANNYGLPTGAVKSVKVSLPTVALGDKDQIVVEITLNNGYTFATNHKDILTTKALDTKTVNTETVQFRQQDFINAIGQISSDQAEQVPEIEKLLAANGLPTTDVKNVELTPITHKIGQLDTLNITVELKKGILVNNKNTIVMNGVETDTTYTQPVKFQESDFKTAFAKTLAKNVNNTNIQAALVAAGLTADEIANISFSSVQVAVGSHLEYNITVTLNNGYTYGKTNQIVIKNAAIASIQTATVNFNQAGFTGSVASEKMPDITKDSIIKLLEANGVPAAAINPANVTLVKNVNSIAPGQLETINVTAQLNPGYYTSGTDGVISLTNVATATMKTDTISSFNNAQFEADVNKSAFKDVSNKAAVTKLLNKYGLSSNVIKDVQVSTQTPLGEKDSITVVINLKSGYLFSQNNKNTLTLSDIKTATTNLQPVKFAEQNFINDINALDAQAVTKQKVDELLKECNLTANQIANVQLSALTKKVGQNETVTITVTLAKGYTFNGSNVITMPNVATNTVYTETVTFDEAKFRQALQTQTATAINAKTAVINALEASGLKADQLNIDSLTITQNTVAVGQLISFNISIQLTNGYLYGQEKSIRLTNVISNTEYKVPVQFNETAFENAVQTKQIDTLNNTTVQNLLTTVSGLSATEIANVTVTPVANTKIGNQEAVNITITLKQGYVFANNQNTMTLTGVATATEAKTTVEFNESGFKQAVNGSKISSVNTKKLVQALLTKYGLTDSEIANVELNVNQTLGEKESINVTVTLAKGYYFDASQTQNSLVMDNISTQTVYEKEVQFNQNQFETAVNGLQSAAVNESELNKLLIANGLTADDLSSVTVSQPTEVVGQKETVTITVNLKKGYIFGNKTSQLVMSDVATATTYTETVDFNKKQFKTAIAKLDNNQVTVSNVTNALISAGLNNDEIATNGITITPNSVKVGQTYNFNITVTLKTGYLFDGNGVINLSDILAKNIKTANVTLDTAAFTKAMNQKSFTDVQNTTMVKQLLEAAHLSADAIANVSVTETPNVAVGQLEEVNVTVNLNPGYLYNNSNNPIVINNISTTTEKTATVNFEQSQFDAAVQALPISAVNTSDLVKALLTKYGINKDAINTVNVTLNPKTLGDPESINVAINLNKGYKFASNNQGELNLTNLATKSVYNIEVSFNQANFIAAVNGLQSAAATQSEITQLLIANGLKQNEITSAVVSQPTHVVGQKEKVNITVELAKGYIFDNQTGTLAMNDVSTATTYTQEVKFDESKFRTVVEELSDSDVNEHTVEKALINAGLTSNEITVNNIAITPNTVKVGEQDSFNIKVTLNNGYLYKTNDVINLQNVASATMKTAQVTLDKQAFIAAMNKESFTDAQNVETVKQLLSQNKLLAAAIANVTITPTNNIAIGSLEAVNVTITLNKGYLYNNSNNPIVINDIKTTTTKTTTVDFQQSGFTTAVNNAQIQAVNTNAAVKTLLEQYGLTDTEIANVTVDSNKNVVGQAETINVTITLKHGYLFKTNNSDTLNLDNLKTATYYTVGIKFQEQNFIHAINALPTKDITHDKVQELLLANGITSSELGNFTITKNPQVLGEKDTVNIVINLTKGNQFNLKNVITLNKVKTATIDATVVKFDQTTFDNQIKALAANKVNAQTIQAALIAAGLKANEINAASIKFTQDPAILNKPITFAISFSLNKGFIFSDETISMSLKHVASQTIKTITIAFNNDAFRAAIQKLASSDVNTQTVLNALEHDGGITAQEIDASSLKVTALTPVIGKAKAFDVTFTLNPGYLYENKSQVDLTNVASKTIAMSNFWISSDLQGNPNVYKNLNSASSPTVIMTNKNLTQFNLNQLGLKGTNAVITADSVDQSPVIKEVLQALAKIPHADQAIANEITYNFNEKLQEWLTAEHLSMSSLNADNFYVVNTLTVTTNSDGLLEVNGKIGFEYYNETNTPLEVPANSVLLNNPTALSVCHGGVVGICYSFDHSALNPTITYDNSQTIRGSNNVKVGTPMLSYNLTSANITHITGTVNRYAQTIAQSGVNNATTKAQDVNPFTTDIKTIKVTLPGVLNDGTATFFNNKPNFDKYLSGLTKETIQSQMLKQDDKIWNFVILMSESVQSIFSEIGKNPTITEFLHSLQFPVATVVGQLTQNQEYGNLAGSIFGNTPVLTWFNQNKPELMSIFNRFKVIVTDNPELNKEFMNKIKSLLGDKFNTVQQHMQGLTAAAMYTLAMKPQAELDKANLGQEFMEILQQFAKTPGLKVAEARLMNDIKTKSLVDIFGTDLQWALELILSSTKSTESNNPAYKFLVSVDNMIKSIEKLQGVSNVGDGRLFDIIDNKDELDIVKNFIEKDIPSFLGLISPQVEQAFNTYTLPYIDLAFDAFFELHLNNIPLIFQALSSPVVDGKVVTIPYVLKNCVKFTPTVTVQSYDQQTHKLTYSNVMNFEFTKNVTINIQPIYNTIKNDTVGQIMVILNKVLKLGLQGNNFGSEAFIDALLRQKGVDPSSGAIKQVLDALPIHPGDGWNRDLLWNLTLGQILQNTKAELVAGESISTSLLGQNMTVNPIVKFDRMSWWVNSNMQLHFNMIPTAMAFVQPIANNLGNWLNDYKNGLSGWSHFESKIVILPALITNIYSIPPTIVNMFCKNTYNFVAGWVNRINTPGYETPIYNYYKDVENINYKVYANKIDSNTSTGKQIINILNGLSRQTSIEGQYIPADNVTLDNQLLPLIINESQTPWIRNASDYYKPEIVVQYNRTNELPIVLKLGALGNIPVTKINIPGGYTVQVKFPMSVPVTYDGGQTWQMQNTISIKLALKA